MPLDKLVLILFCVVTGLGLAVWLAFILAAVIAAPVLFLLLIPIAVACYILYRVIAERVGNKEDDYYDRMDH